MTALIALAALLAPRVRLDDWKTIGFPGGFSVDSPVSLETMSTQGDQSPSKTSKMWMAMQGGCVYMAFREDAQPDQMKRPDLMLAGAAMGFVVRDGVTIKSERDLALNGWPGLEIEVGDASGHRLRARTYLCGTAMFSVIASWTEKAPNEQAVSRYLLSATMPKTAGKGPLTKAGPTFSAFKLPGTDVSVDFPGQPERKEFPSGDESHRTTLISFESPYGNRDYFCNYLDYPSAFTKELTDNPNAVMATINSRFLEAMEAQVGTPSFVSLGGKTWASTRGKLARGFTARVDSVISGTRIYSFIVFVPEVMMDSDEVKGFFKSIKIN